MSHHFDTPTAIADGRINLCDFYVFPAAPGNTVFILTVNPDAGRSSARTFRPDALYEFVVASGGDTFEDIAFRVRFDDPNDRGLQQVRVLRAEGTSARHGSDGILLGEGKTGAVFPLGTGGMAWAGQAADPFTADGVALAAFLQGLAEGDYRPEAFTAPPLTSSLAETSRRSPCSSPMLRSAGPGSRRGLGSVSSATPRSSR